MRLVIDQIPPSNNKYMGRGRKGDQFKYQEDKQLWSGLILQAAQRKHKPPECKCIVSITYYFPTKGRRDPDNYSGKFILDGLVNCGILRDDSFDHVILELIGGYDKSYPRTEIMITEAP